MFTNLKTSLTIITSFIICTTLFGMNEPHIQQTQDGFNLFNNSRETLHFSTFEEVIIFHGYGNMAKTKSKFHSIKPHKTKFIPAIDNKIEVHFKTEKLQEPIIRFFSEEAQRGLIVFIANKISWCKHFPDRSSSIELNLTELSALQLRANTMVPEEWANLEFPAQLRKLLKLHKPLV